MFFKRYMIQMRRLAQKQSLSWWVNKSIILMLGWVTLLALIDWFANPLSQQEQIKMNQSLPLIRDWHLMGTYQAPPRAATATQLPLNLVGIMAAAQADQAQAIIATLDGQEKVYHIGDNLPGGVILQQILPDAVLIQHNNRLEKLSLPAPQLDWRGPPQDLHGS